MKEDGDVLPPPAAANGGIEDDEGEEEEHGLVNGNGEALEEGVEE